MIEFRVALNKAKEQAYPLIIDLIHFGEIPGKFVFFPKDSLGMIPPGGGAITVDKESGECKFEYLEREGDKPFSPFKNFRVLKLDKVAIN